MKTLIVSGFVPVGEFALSATMVLALALGATSGSLRAQPDVDRVGDEHGSDEPAVAARLSPRDLEDFGIRTAVAGPGSIRNELRLPGEIRLNEDAVAHVGPRFAGVATAIRRRLGDEVRTGEILAVMETNDTLRPFELKAPIDGTVVNFHLTLGESLDAGEYAYIVADTSTVWVDLRFYQRDLLRVRVDQRVQVSAGHGFDPVDGVISYIGPVVDESTRTGLARVVLNNEVRVYRPGLFVVGTVVLEESRFPVVVPLSALQRIDGESVVFLRRDDKAGFEPRVVEVGRSDSRHAEIRSGIEAGEEYVSVGGFFLKAETQKEHFGDGHAH